LGDWLVSQSVS